jgi:hypothetical protein
MKCLAEQSGRHFVLIGSLNLSYSEVSGFFNQRGTYSKFKTWLDQENLLETWYEYEATQTEQTLMKWLKTHSIPSA